MIHPSPLDPPAPEHIRILFVLFIDHRHVPIIDVDFIVFNNKFDRRNAKNVVI